MNVYMVIYAFTIDSFHYSNLTVMPQNDLQQYCPDQVCAITNNEHTITTSC